LPVLDESLGNFIEAFRTLSYEVCTDGDEEAGFEKVALYGRNGLCLHAARQLTSGKWASKLGVDIDIEHIAHDSLEGPAYGQVVVFMRRAIPAPDPI
jgi:hypothetical protein